MAAYVIADVSVHDADSYDDYKRMAPVSIAKYGGRYLARGGATEPLEGTWRPTRLVILEFPTYARAKEWWASAEYAPAKALRHQTATSNLMLLEGFDPGPIR
jgi:uncharacterized protein (DUF1330 family)